MSERTVAVTQHLTDIHLDLEDECSGSSTTKFGSFGGQYGCGVTMALMNATTRFMRQTVPMGR